jgi:SNF2 family DNA or RNA helicase
VTDSWEAYYQAVRRCWRFGQSRPVHVHLFASEQEGSVMKNLMRKEREAEKMAESLSKETAAIVAEQVRGMKREHNAYEPRVAMTVPAWVGVDA